MNWIAITWPMVAAACLTLGMIELRIGLAQPPRAARLLFALSALVVAVVAGLELAMMRTDVLAEWWPLMRWMDIAVGVMIVSLTAFIWVYFGTGNKWLALAVPCLYALGLVFDYFPGPPGSGMTYRMVTGFRTVETFGGAAFSLAEGVPNPWNVFPYLAVLMLIVFVVDASVRSWRRGERRRAAVIGGAVVFFFLLAGAHSAMVETGIVQTPYLISWSYLAILVAMGSELNADVLAGARLGRRLQESERRMELASSAANLGMWAWDIVRDLIWATSKARSLLGFSESERLSGARFLSAMHPADRETVERAVREAIAKNAEFDIEYRVPGPDGKLRWIAARGRSEDGRDQRLLGVAVDVTERKIAEMQAAKASAELRHMTRVSMLGQLSAAIAHQLNQPLAAILGNAEAAQKMLGRDKVDLMELREICNDIVSEDHRASQIIGRLRDLYKRGDTKMEPLDLNQLIGETLDLVRPELLARHITVATDLASMLPMVEGSRVQLQQVLLNLALNAADAMSETAIEQRNLTIRTEVIPANVQMYFVDHGLGIATDDLKRIFDAFWSTKPEGMGIGLAICESIVAVHRGSITAANNAEGGATFCVKLPIRQHP
jgi:PAS domain S-box-containing protein